MIDKLELKNFQAHLSSKFEFHPGINIITGQSDQGKSSIIRALHWLFFNKPSGKEFMSWGQDKCIVSAYIRGNIIRRYKTSTINRYVINSQKLDAVRSDVPRELHEIINFTPTNLQLQDDPYFLLHSNSGDVAKQLNKVVGIDQIDSSLQFVNRIVRQQNTVISIIKKDINETQQKLRRYADVDLIEASISKYNNLQKSLEEIKSKKHALGQYVQNVERLQKTVDLDIILKKAERKVSKVNELLHNLQKNREMQNSLKKYVIQTSELYDFVEKSSPIITQTTKLLKQFLDVQGVLKEIKQQKKDFLIVQELFEYQEILITCEEQAEQSNKELEEYKKLIKVCPLCEQILKTGE